ncbi:hypothetical protein LTR66_014445, partial [Elasticomyces elasticus]
MATMHRNTLSIGGGERQPSIQDIVGSVQHSLLALTARLEASEKKDRRSSKASSTSEAPSMGVVRIGDAAPQFTCTAVVDGRLK